MRSLIENRDLIEIQELAHKALDKVEGSCILVTGAAGFLGRYFTKLFEEYNKNSRNPVKIVAIDNHITSLRSDASSRLTNENIEWIYGDAKIGAQLPNRFDYIIHCAGIASPQHYRSNPLETIYVAVDVTRALLEKARSDKARMLFFSSSEIYGDPDISQIPTPEEYRGNVSSRGPRACYDESKRLGETLCYVFQEKFDTHVSVVRPFNIYGPGMLPHDYRVLPNFASSLISGEKLKVYGRGSQTRTFCYITDAMNGFLRVLIESERPDVFNVGNPNPEISMVQLAEMSCSVFRTNNNFELIEYPNTYPADEPNRRCPDISKIQKTLNYIPNVQLRDGLERFYSWAKEYYPNHDLL